MSDSLQQLKNLKYAEGMEKAIALHQQFSDDSQAVAFWAQGAEAVPVQDIEYPASDGQRLAARIYRGSDSADAPALLYIHGGGWVGGSIAANEWSATALAKYSGWNVVSISYSLAPLHPFPAALKDCRAALSWLAGNATATGLTPCSVALGGASAGANLAVATAIANSNVIPISGLLLFYGVFSCNFETRSYSDYANGPGLTRARMSDLFSFYDPLNQRSTEPLITPLLSTRLGCMPSACLIAAEHDVLLDDSRMMAAALKNSGVTTDLYIEQGVTHGYINRGREVPSANTSLKYGAQFLKALNYQQVVS